MNTRMDKTSSGVAHNRPSSFMPSNISIGDMLSNGKKYIVPKYQRNYSWEKENWQDLWHDLEKCYKDNNHWHFLGNIVLSERQTEKEFEIIDGQQRLATVSIIAIVLINYLQDLVANNIDKEKNEERIRIYKERLISSTEGETLYSRPKLELNKKNNAYYKDHLAQIHIVKPSENHSKQLHGAVIFFQNLFKEKNNGTIIKSGEEISRFLDIIINRLFVIQITVADENYAYLLFECLNARGLDLSPADLIKNYIFSRIRIDSDADIISSKWQELEDITTPKKLPTFIRYFHNCTEKEVVNERDLFKKLKDIIQVSYKNNIDKFINDLLEYAKIYRALINPNDSLWVDDGGSQQIKHVITIFKNLGVQQPIIILMPSYRNFDISEFIRTVKYLIILTIRYNIVCHKNPNEQESLYNKIAVKINKNEIKNASDIKSEIRNIYPNDREFESNFENFSIKKEKIIKYFLVQIENALSNKFSTTQDDESDIEHILPKSWHETWGELFTTTEHEEFYKRFGNYCLLETRINSKLKNSMNFKNKKEKYKSSAYSMAQELSEEEVWDKDAVNKRQEKLTKQALKIWSFDNVDNI